MKIKFFGIFLSTLSLGTDTISLSYLEAEKKFYERNLSIIANHFNITISDALIEQAKLWQNPILNLELGIYNPATEKWLDMSKTGQQVIEIQQLIFLAHKRRKNITYQKFTKIYNETAFLELLSALRYELIESYYTLHNIIEKIKILEKQINPIQNLSDSFYEQYKKGNIPYKEVSRLNSLVLSLKTEQNQLYSLFWEIQKKIKVLLSDTSSAILLPITPYPILEINPNITILNLQEEALTNNPMLKTIEQKIQVLQSNLVLQKALKVPDLTLGLLYDRAGSYIMDYRALSISVPIPLFNRNQYNIKIAMFEIEKLNYEKKQIEIQILQNIQSSYNKIQHVEKLFIEYQNKLDDDFKKLFDSMVYNYQKKNITLTEFVDFYESYTSNVLQYLDIQLERLRAIEELNYYIGKKIF